MEFYVSSLVCCITMRITSPINQISEKIEKYFCWTKRSRVGKLGSEKVAYGMSQMDVCIVNMEV